MPKIIAEKKDWVELGFKLFAKQGQSAIIIDKIAKQLSCNRSSFYWHFKSKEKFIEEILLHWIETETTQIIKQVKNENKAEKRFKVFITTAFKSDPNRDFVFHLKGYALKRKDIQSVIDKIEEQKLYFIFSLIVDLGYDREEATDKAQILYKYLLGYQELIRYKKQSKNYVDQIYADLKHFIKL